jgi:hypothetical protein
VFEVGLIFFWRMVSKVFMGNSLLVLINVILLLNLLKNGKINVYDSSS